MSKVWFVTGASRGLGRIWVEAALARGDRVAATARDVASLADLTERFGEAVLPVQLDVGDAEQARDAIERANRHFGSLDIVLNNAGYTLVGTTEETTEEEAKELFDANYFGMLRIIKAALPILRAQGHGHIIGVSSSLAIAAMPLIGYYCATKWATEALHESLAQEVASFGIKVSLVEPGAYATGFAASRKMAKPLDVYAPLRQQIMGRLHAQVGGVPEATAEAILKLVDASEPPLRFAMGTTAGALTLARKVYPERLASWEEWEPTINAAQGRPVT